MDKRYTYELPPVSSYSPGNPRSRLESAAFTFTCVFITTAKRKHEYWCQPSVSNEVAKVVYVHGNRYARRLSR